VLLLWLPVPRPHPPSLHPACLSAFINFFFQAEDGIRDFHVTGVQTCALPISLRRRCARRRGHGAHRRRNAGLTLRRRRRPRGARSEERRVGKECRSRWTPRYPNTKSTLAETTASDRYAMSKKLSSHVCALCIQ